MDSVTKISPEGEAVLQELAEDFADLWKVNWIVGAELELEDAEVARPAALATIRELVENGYVRPGVPEDRSNFAPWDVTNEDALSRIEREWNEIGREPEIAEIVWFDLTASGRRYVEALPATP